jgi:hypothetical protein
MIKVAVRFKEELSGALCKRCSIEGGTGYLFRNPGYLWGVTPVRGACLFAWVIPIDRCIRIKSNRGSQGLNCTPRVFFCKCNGVFFVLIFRRIGIPMYVELQDHVRFHLCGDLGRDHLLNNGSEAPGLVLRQGHEPILATHLFEGFEDHCFGFGVNLVFGFARLGGRRY